MDTDLLDDEFIIKNQKESIPRFLNWLTIFILWSGIGICIAFGLMYDTQVIIAILLLFIATIFNYYKYRIGTKITFGIILLGVFNFIRFSPFTYGISFGIGGFILKVEVILFTLLIIHYYTNREVLSKFFSQLMNVDTSYETNRAITRGNISGFKRRFSKKSTEELNAIINNPKILSDAKTAAQEVINERNIGNEN